MSEKKLDVKKYLQRVIIACWVALVVCLIIKLFGGNIFEIVCNNNTFKAICTYADNHIWANYMLCAINSLISLYFFTLAILQELKFKPWQLLVFIISVLGSTALKSWNAKIGIIGDVWTAILMPILFIGKKWKSYWKILVANILVIIFQLISMFIKNLNVGDIYNSTLFALIYSLDVIIMLILYFAYANFIKVKKQQKIEIEESKQNE